MSIAKLTQLLYNFFYANIHQSYPKKEENAGFTDVVPFEWISEVWEITNFNVLFVFLIGAQLFG